MKACDSETARTAQDASPVQRVDGRRAAAEETREERRWAVEVTYEDGEWFSDFEQPTTREEAEQWMARCAKNYLHSAVRLVAVVERRTVVETRQAASSIEKLSDGLEEKL